MKRLTAWQGVVGLALTALLAAGCSSGLGDGGTPAGTVAFAARGGLPSEPVQTGPQRIENPGMAELMKAGPLGDRSMGRADAPVTVIEYASLTCPYCRAFHAETFPAFKRHYIDTGKVRYMLREFPIGRSSGNAWLVTRCAEGDDYFRLYELFLKNQPKWVSQEVRTEEIFKIARKVGMDRARFDACLANQGTIDGINWVKERGRQLGVSGTPTFFFNEKKVRSMLSFEELQAILEPMLKARLASSG